MFLFLDYSLFGVSSSRFTCSSSSEISNKQTCSNVYNYLDSSGWFTKQGIGAWIQISFHDDVLISEIVLRTNRDIRTYDEGAYRQNFKDISVGFSDSTYINITLDDTVDADFRYKITPPKLSSILKLEVYSVYSFLTKFDQIAFDQSVYINEERNRYGISKIRLYSSLSRGKFLFVKK